MHVHSTHPPSAQEPTPPVLQSCLLLRLPRTTWKQCAPLRGFTYTASAACRSTRHVQGNGTYVHGRPRRPLRLLHLRCLGWCWSTSPRLVNGYAAAFLDHGGRWVLDGRTWVDLQERGCRGLGSRGGGRWRVAGWHLSRWCSDGARQWWHWYDNVARNDVHDGTVGVLH